MIGDRPRLERKPGTREWRVYWPDNALAKSRARVLMTPERNDEGFLFSFLQTLDGVLLTSIRQCSECNNLLFQSGKMERSFCSTRCRSRKANRERRKRIREEGGSPYKEDLAKGKERARASYERKQKAQSGANVKVGKNRPRKTRKES